MKLFGGERNNGKDENSDPFGYNKVFSEHDSMEPSSASGEELSEEKIEEMYNHIIEMDDAIKDVANGFIKQEKPFSGYTQAYNVDYLEKMQAKKRAIEIDYTASLLPDQNKDSFVEWANKPESEFDFDLIVKGIFASKLGAPEDMIKDSIVSADRGLGEEGNRKMGEVAYNQMIKFLGEEDNN